MTWKAINKQYPDIFVPGIHFGAYSIGHSSSFSWDNEGHATGYGPFVYTLDPMGRPVGLTETGPGTVWVQNVAYGPGGELTTMRYQGDGKIPYFTENRRYNNRSQLAQLQITNPRQSGMNWQYGYPAGANNGQIAQITNAVSGEQIVYTYDSLKRLIKAETTQNQAAYPGAPWWGQAFEYDGFGNLLTKSSTVGHPGAPVMALSVDPSTNHPTTAGFAFDANGNMTSMPALPHNLTLSYDVENRTGGGPFDQQNQPLLRAGTWNQYGLRGERLGTYTYQLNSQVFPEGNEVYVLQWETETRTSRNVYFGSKLIQANDVSVATDHLGSVRGDANGIGAEYYPYGENTSSYSVLDREQFATYTRESATGLDYAVNRYYTSIYGRFATADPYDGSARLANPTATLNRYNYVLGDPIGNSDPSGLAGSGACGSEGGPDLCNIDGGVGFGGGSGGGIDPCAWNPYDASCGGPAGGNGFVPIMAGAGIGGLGGVLIGGPVGACIASVVCGVAVAAGVAVAGGVAIWSVNHAGDATDSARTGDSVPVPKTWQPCLPPVGTIGYRLDRVPPSKPHYPHTGDHVHLYKMNQNPNDGRCFWSDIGSTAPPPPPGAVPIGPALGGAGLSQ